MVEKIIDFSLTDEKRNDPQYMYELIRADYDNIIEIGDNLRENPDFMISLVKLQSQYNKEQLYPWAKTIYYTLGQGLKNNAGFMVKFFDEMAKYSSVPKNVLFYTFITRIVDDPSFSINNEEFWKEIEKRGLMNAEYEYCRHQTTDVLTDRQQANLNNLSTLLVTNPVYMAEVIAISPRTYFYTNKRLRNDKLFEAIIKFRTPEVKEYLPTHKTPVYVRRLTALQNAALINESNYMSYLTDSDRRNTDFMIRLIQRNYKTYLLVYSPIRQQKPFMQKALKANSKVKDFIEADREEIQRRKDLIKDTKTKAKEKDKQRELEDLTLEYEYLGDKHPYLVLVKNFLNSNTSKGMFCKKNNISIDELNKAIEEVMRVYPDLHEQINKHSKQSSMRYFYKISNIVQSLLSGEMTIEQYYRNNTNAFPIDEILSGIDNIESNDNIRKMVVDAMASGKLSMMDYIKLFGKQDSKNVELVISEAKEFLRTTGKFIPELVGTKKPINIANSMVIELKKYKRPYKATEFLDSKRGFVNPNTGKLEMVTVTQEHLDYAKKYLHLNGEYICATTMGETLSKLIKGEISKEEIDKRYEEMTAKTLERKKSQKKQKLEILQGISKQISDQDQKEDHLRSILGNQIQTMELKEE